MAGALTIHTVKELYPVSNDARASALVREVVTQDRNVDGYPILTRALTTEEGDFLQQRRAVLSDALGTPHDREIRKSVSQMLSGFMAGKEIPDDVAKATITQYIIALRHLPWWATERACLKFARGEVTVIRDEDVKLAFGPSTAQLYQVASEICQDFYAEHRNVVLALQGVVERKIPLEERQRVQAKLDALHLQLQSGLDAERDEKRMKRLTAYVSPTDLSATPALKEALSKRHRLLE